jgi:hypothetical protein
MGVVGLDHMQVAAPRGCEAEARRFYGILLGLEEIDKPERSCVQAACRLGVSKAHTIPDMYRLATLQIAPASPQVSLPARARVERP